MSRREREIAQIEGQIYRAREAAWLADKITAARRVAQPKHCPRCGASILIGPDSDTTALTVAVDVEPIDVYTEVQATAAGIDTYNAWPAPGGQTVELHYRISFHRHGIRQVPVLAEHTCEDQ